MLLDAFNAERFRLLRDRGALFWGFAFPGIGVFLLGVLASLFVRYVAHKTIPGGVNLGEDMIGAFSGAGSPITQIFFLIGAAAIFGTDYRWETWRLQTPRNSRLNLMAAKFTIYGVAAALALVGMALGGLLSGLFRAVVETAPMAGIDVARLTPAFLRGLAGAWLEVMVVGAVAALIAVVSRTNVAAIIVTLLLAFAQAIIMGVAHFDPVKPPVDALAIFPALSASVVRGAPVAIGNVSAQGAGLATLFLLIWMGVLIALTTVIFQRQELARE